MKWRVASKCDDCPFSKSGPGLALRRSLRRGRMAEITATLRTDGHFHCHKTTMHTDDDEASTRNALLCAGAIEWQEKRGYSSQLVRIMERIDSIQVRAVKKIS